jgi:hypothetical protein
LAGGTTLAAGTEYFDTFAANRTFSAITGTVVEGSVIKIEMNVTVAMAITFTPSVYRYGESGTAGPIAFSPGTHFVQLKRSGGVWRLGDSATPLNKLNATTAPTTGDDAADGYAVGSLWIDQTADLVYHCVDSTVGAAVWKGGGQRDVWVVPIGDETTAITTGTGKVTFRAPYACTITGVRASLTTASSSGIPTFNIKEGGTTIFSTSLTVASGAKTSVGGTPAVLSDTAFSDDAEITIDVTTAGTGAAGAKVSIYVTR